MTSLGAVPPWPDPGIVAFAEAIEPHYQIGVRQMQGFMPSRMWVVVGSDGGEMIFAPDVRFVFPDLCREVDSA